MAAVSPGGGWIQPDRDREKKDLEFWDFSP
jgi:hypothetical protein